jgi:DNA polymerase-3 subunit epsilon
VLWSLFWPSPDWDAVVYWALDLETGGMDPRRDPILSIGMVPVRSGGIRLGEAYRTLVRPGDAATIDPSSIAAHQLLPGEVRSAPPLAEVLKEVDARIRDSVLLVHHAPLDVGFLRRAYKLAGRRWPRPQVVDTVTLLMKEARRARFLAREGQTPEPQLNLAAARRALGLPEYAAHDALTDAIAAAELFLVLQRRLNARHVRDLL